MNADKKKEEMFGFICVHLRSSAADISSGHSDPIRW
jgi:hypothetical protein